MKVFIFPLQFLFCFPAPGDVPDVALDNLLVVHEVGIADKFPIDVLALSCFQRQFFVPDIPVSFQLCERVFCKGLVFEKPKVPEVPANEILRRVSQHFEDGRVRIGNFPCVSVKDQDPVTCRLEQPSVLEF